MFDALCFLQVLRRLMAADFIPADLVELHSSMTADDLNQLMLDQAIMASMAADAVGSPSMQAQQGQGMQAVMQMAPQAG